METCVSLAGQVKSAINAFNALLKSKASIELLVTLTGMNIRIQALKHKHRSI